MRLKKLTVARYRSIKQQEELIVDSRVTILIGANDHGKSNLLSAMQCLNDDRKISADDKNWDATPDSVVEIKWHFSCSDEDLAKIKKLATPQGAAPPAPQPESKTGTAEEIPVFPVSPDGRDVIYSRDLKSNSVKVDSVPFPSVPIAAEAEILKLRPRVEIFESPTSNLRDQVNLSDLEQPDFEFMQGIFRLAGIWDIRKSIFAQNDKTSRALDEASTRLTKVLNDKWNQGKELRWKLKHTGTNGDNIVIEIEDPAIKGRYTRPSLRSSGFRTYFLLSMIVSARTQNKKANSFIYLFDEPGTYLHPHAQLDLQRSFETIADEAQIVYTTHSLFLVNKNHPERNRVISKTRSGTKIDQKPYTKNWKAVRDSLGILMSNNFLIAEKTLLVEGPSDIIYLLDAIKTLKAAGQVDIDINDFSVVDAGDSKNYIAMTKLMLSEGREIVSLLDGDNAGDTIEGQLNRICAAEIRNKKLQILKLPDGQSSEDVFANIDALKEAARKAYESLIRDRLRVSRQGINLEQEINLIVPVAGTTLGRTLDEQTASWFEPAERISKLLVAVMYEDVRDNNDGPISESAKTIIDQVKVALNLRGEKSAETGVFEEIQED